MDRRRKNNRREPPILRSEPWLVYSHGKHNKSQTFYSSSERSCQVRNIRKMRNRTIWAHCQGWLVLLDIEHSDCSLFNPVTMEELRLPRFPFTAKSIDHCALSSPPTTDNCVVMCIEYCGRRKQSSFHFCRPGDKDWTTQLVKPQQGQCWYEEDTHSFHFQNIVSFNGEFYVVSECCQGLFKVQLAIDELGTTNNDASVELLDMKLREPGDHFVSSTMMSSSFMVQGSPTELMTVKLYYGDNRDTDSSFKVRSVEGFKIGVKQLNLYKANFQERKWERLETLPEDTAIFLGSNSNNAVSYQIPRRQEFDVGGGLVRGNTVYFTTTSAGYLYAYDVGDRSISVSLVCSKANRPDYSEPHWIMPLGCSSSTDDPQREFEISPDEIGNEPQIILSSTTGNNNSSSTTDHDGRHWSYDIPRSSLHRQTIEESFFPDSLTQRSEWGGSQLIQPNYQCNKYLVFRRLESERRSHSLLQTRMVAYVTRTWG
ncbi:unnamed protein product [Linum trigynum]|uniref:KIB1-4 beta-propeller domain-containing protein n=1 Tax=Linum trigynum TaxID=586398 RepID=A0AAV2ELH5_9ROSI